MLHHCSGDKHLVLTTVTDSGFVSLEFYPVVWLLFTKRKIQVNTKQTKVRHYKPCENAQSAHWPVLGWSKKYKALCSGLLKNMENIYAYFTARC